MTTELVLPVSQSMSGVARSLVCLTIYFTPRPIICRAPLPVTPAHRNSGKARARSPAAVASRIQGRDGSAAWQLTAWQRWGGKPTASRAGVAFGAVITLSPITLPFLSLVNVRARCSLGSAAACHRPSQIWHQVRPPALDSGRLVRPKSSNARYITAHLSRFASCHLCLCVNFLGSVVQGTLRIWPGPHMLVGFRLRLRDAALPLVSLMDLSTVHSLVLRSVVRANFCHRGVISNVLYVATAYHNTGAVLWWF